MYVVPKSVATGGGVGGSAGWAAYQGSHLLLSAIVVTVLFAFAIGWAREVLLPSKKWK